MLGVPFVSKFFDIVTRREIVSDAVDGLSHFVTTYMIAMFAIAVSCKQFFGKPMNCWTPKEFNGGWDQYAENYCFTSNSYHVPWHQSIPGIEDRGDKLTYYRWVPIVLCIQAFFFFLPNLIWQTLVAKTTIDPANFLSHAGTLKMLTGQRREQKIKEVADYFMFMVKEFDSQGSSSLISQNSGRSATLLYLATKLMYLLNVTVQMLFLDYFLGGNFSGAFYSWGLNTIDEVLEKHDQFDDSPFFPKVITCDFLIRTLANTQRYSVQCVIMLNMINEKFYLLLLFWFAFVFIVTLCSFFYYVWMLFPTKRINMIRFNIEANYRNTRLPTNEVSLFVRECLHPDGALLLKFVDMHCGGAVAHELTAQLMSLYTDSHMSSSFKRYGEEDKTPEMEKKNLYPQVPTQVSAPLLDYCDQGTMRMEKTERTMPTDL